MSMKRRVRPVSEIELQNVMGVVSRAVQWMHDNGSIQWNETYPAISDFQLDVEHGALWGIYEEEMLCGVCAVDQQAYPEYGVVQWENTHMPVFYLHRVAVDPQKHGRGLAGDLICHAIRYARQQGGYALRTDTNEKNIPMRRTFEKLGFAQMEPTFLLEHNLAMGPCVAYEKTWVKEEEA